MTTKAPLLETLTLHGIKIAPSQTCGSLRLVPLLRTQTRGDLRLFRRSYSEKVTAVTLENHPRKPNLEYISYIPHGLVLNWTEDGSAISSYGGQFIKDGERLGQTVRILHRMVKREDKNQLRLLPLHLAMEGFLALYFSGPEIAWQEYSRQLLAEGLNPRWEISYQGRSIPGFDRALRLFEIHEGQVGVLIFVAETLASAFIVPTPEDYRALHESLLEDFYGELIFQYGLLYETTYPMATEVRDEEVENLGDLRSAIAKMREEWAHFQGFMASDLLGRAVKSQRIYTTDCFTLQRFITDLNPKAENHTGEAIIRATGEIEYLKTYRLSVAQTKRVYLLSQLAKHEWNLAATANSLKITEEELVDRFERVGFSYLLKQNVRERARKERKKNSKFPYR
ncbi:hypothetical protein [Oscillatoria sp. FACHB-1406]|uniref:ARPP-2 domain-containing protein n=1 Tax=Oscillatoria sp. FACHB-1406 TaxID=2692846 RepID=UPI001682DBB8|nr:hypothetical protein [Oscillatoria sp. FACHB-1406]MBD2578731.1 hypothetical protein [Oscillatoria sp. FACHB-1406]